MPVNERSAFLESLTDTDLYSMGAFFCDEHPDLVDEVVDRSAAIERRGLEAYANANGVSVEESFGTLLTLFVIPTVYSFLGQVHGAKAATEAAAPVPAPAE